MEKSPKLEADLQQDAELNPDPSKETPPADMKEAAIAIGDYADAGRTYPFTTW